MAFEKTDMSAANDRTAAPAVASSNDYSNLPKAVGLSLQVSISSKHVPTNRSLGRGSAPLPAHMAARYNTSRSTTLTPRPSRHVNVPAHRRRTFRPSTAYGISGSSLRQPLAASTTSTGLPSSTSRSCHRQRVMPPSRRSCTTSSRRRTCSSPSSRFSSCAPHTSYASGALSYSHCCYATQDIYTQRGWKWVHRLSSMHGTGAVTMQQQC
jgi:hypothetical protein